MIEANHNGAYVRFFSVFSESIISHYFHRQLIEGEFVPDGRPLLLVSNHIGWWDGFWMLQLNKRVLHRRFFVMMQEEQLRRYLFFRRIGAFSMGVTPRGILESLNYARMLLMDSRNLLVIFPQGNLQSVYQDKIHFKRGAEYILGGMERRPQILFVANLIDFNNRRKLTLTTYLETYRIESGESGFLEREYALFYNRCLSKQKERGEM